MVHSPDGPFLVLNFAKEKILLETLTRLLIMNASGMNASLRLF